VFTAQLADVRFRGRGWPRYDAVMAKETLETSLGSIWIEDLSSGEMRICWPYGSRAGELAVGILEGKARWHPKSKGWYVAAARRYEIYEELTAL